MVRNKAQRKKSARHLSISALAMRKNPALFSRPQGQLRQQTFLSRSQRRRILNEGDEVLAKCIDIDPSGRIRLSRKEALAEVAAQENSSESE